MDNQNTMVLTGFQDREEGGQKLAQALKNFKGAKDTLILALPRGGVVTGAEVAKILDLPLNVFVARKIGAPGNPEFALGAIAETGELVMSHHLAKISDLTPQLRKIAEDELEEINRRIKEYRGELELPSLKNKTVILIDDGIATGQTLEVAIQGIKGLEPKQLILASPVAAPDTIKLLRPMVDKSIILFAPYFFSAVGQFYADFPQVTDDQVKELLKSYRKNQS